MSTNINYASMPLADLLVEQKKLKNKQLLAGFAVGFLLGIVIFSFFKNGFKFLPIAIPAMLIVPIIKNSSKTRLAMEEVKAAITLRNTA